MAVQVYKPTKTPPQAVIQFAKDLQNDILENFATQQIWPFEVYPGYAKVNADRFARGKWYSTGEGYKSIETIAHTTPGKEAIVLRFLDYLRFVDMGVGKGTKWEQVQNEKKARFDRRYISAWDRKVGQSHRPAFLMQAHRVANRMMIYFEDYYARESQFIVLKSFDGLTPITFYI